MSTHKDSDTENGYFENDAKLKAIAQWNSVK